MTPEQRERLESLLPGMLSMAHGQVRQNDFHRAINERDRLVEFLNGRQVGAQPTAAQWLEIAERVTEGAGEDA